jgi:hypothetical protein
LSAEFTAWEVFSSKVEQVMEFDLSIIVLHLNPHFNVEQMTMTFTKV